MHGKNILVLDLIPLNWYSMMSIFTLHYLTKALNSLHIEMS